MKTRTLFQCWTMLISLILFALITEFIVTTFAGGKGISLHRIAPITSLPLLLKKNQKPSLKSEAKVKEELQQTKILLTNGKELTGRLIETEENWITVVVDGSRVGLKKTEIKQILPYVPDNITAENK